MEILARQLALTSTACYVRIRALGAVFAAIENPAGASYFDAPNSRNFTNVSLVQPVAECANVAAPATRLEADLKGVLAFTACFAAAAGWMDYRSRRIPNWLTVSGFLAGVAANTAVGGWQGLKASLLGTGLGLLLLLPLVMLRSLGAGDLKFAAAVGAFVGPRVLFDLLLASIFVAGVMAAVLIIYKRRVRETLRNMGHMLSAFASLRLPGPDVSLDNPRSLKVPYGVALAFTVVLYAIARARGAV